MGILKVAPPGRGYMMIHSGDFITEKGEKGWWGFSVDGRVVVRLREKYVVIEPPDLVAEAVKALDEAGVRPKEG